MFSGIPVTVAYWTATSYLADYSNSTSTGKPLSEYMTFKDSALVEKYAGKQRIPMTTFHDLYFEGKIEIKG